MRFHPWILCCVFVALTIASSTLLAIGLQAVPTTLTQGEMREPTGQPCVPSECSQLLRDKQLASEGFRLAVAGGAGFGFSLLGCLGLTVYIQCRTVRLRGRTSTQIYPLQEQV